jgi:putative ABC transport system permease protein
VAAINPNIGYSFRIFDTWIQESLLSERLMAVLSTLFGALAIALTAIGLFGVISYTVSQRTSEIGIRIALGASRGTVIAFILREIAIVVAVGLVSGTLLSLAAARSASTLFFGLQSYDPPTFALAAIAIATLAVAASYIPARRASMLNPVIALRQE